MRPPSSANARRIARVELRRTIRNATDGASGVATLLALGLGVPMFSLFAAGLGFLVGGLLADGGLPAAAPSYAGVAFAALALFAAFFVAQTSLQNGRIDGLDGLLTTVPYEDVVAGLVLATTARGLAYVGLPIVAATVGAGVGSRSVALPVVLLACTLATLLVGVLLGHVLGFLVTLVTNRSAFLTRHKGSIGFVLSLLLPAVWILGWQAPGGMLALGSVLLHSPLTWFGHLVFLGVPDVAAEPVRALVAAGSTAGLVVAASAGLLWLAERVWYGDAVQPEHEYVHDSAGSRLGGVLPLTVRVVVGKSWRRARRAPFTVQYAVFPFFALVFQVQYIVVERAVPPGLPVELAVASAFTAGAAFSLNPLGGEEGVLPLTLTANVTGKQFVLGLGLAGLAIGLPLAVGLPVVTGFLAGLAPSGLVAAVLTGTVLTVAAPGVAAGFGIVFPKFERSTIQGGREVVVPSGWAFLFYSLLLGATALPALVVQVPFTRSLVAGLVSVGTTGLLAGGVLATAVLSLVAGAVGFAVAANRVAEHRLG